MAGEGIQAILHGMKSSGPPVALPLDYVSELCVELHLMRGECSEAARRALRQPHIDEVALEECALIDEALAKAKRVLDAALEQVKRSRVKKKKRSR